LDQVTLKSASLRDVQRSSVFLWTIWKTEQFSLDIVDIGWFYSFGVLNVPDSYLGI
jgi:hypothetical protein